MEIISERKILKSYLFDLDVLNSDLYDQNVVYTTTSTLDMYVYVCFFLQLGNELSAKGWRRLSQLLVTPALIELTELKIDESELDSEVALTVFAPALRKLSRLKMLSLCHCELHPAGALGVAMVVGNIAAFEELKIDGNSVSGIVVARIQTLLNSNNKILTGKKLITMLLNYLQLILKLVYFFRELYCSMSGITRFTMAWRLIVCLQQLSLCRVL